MSTSVPQDIKTQWMGVHKALFNVIRRMQSVSKSGGLSVVTIRVVVNAEGCPISWTEPQVTRIEPRGTDALLAALTGHK